MEEWQDIAGYEGIYKISTNSRVLKISYATNKRRVNFRAKWLKTYHDSLGYMKVGLVNKNGERKGHFVHRLIAIAFIPNPDNKPHINHKDLIKDNNNIDNLEWCTPLENTRHAVLNFAWAKAKQKKKIQAILEKKGLVSPKKRLKNKLSVDEVLEIRKGECSNILYSKRFNVTPQTIYSIIKRINWKNI